MRGLVGALLLFCIFGLASVLFDLDHLLAYNWSNGLPTYRKLATGSGRPLHSIKVALLVSLLLSLLFCLLASTSRFRWIFEVVI